MKGTRLVALFLSAVLMGGLSAAKGHTQASTSAFQAIPLKIEGEVVLGGKLLLDGAVQIPKDAHLTIEPGAVVRPGAGSGISVHGRLTIVGEEGDHVIVAPAEGGVWKGITFLAGSEGTLARVEMEGAETALSLIASRVSLDRVTVAKAGTAVHLVREASARITGCRFRENRIAVAVDMKSVAQVSGCLFEGNQLGLGIASGGLPEIAGNRFVGNGMGIQVLQRYPGRIHGNLFQDNKAGVRLYQNGPDTVVDKNRFERHQDAAVLADSYSSPTISNNFITGGKYGIYANQYSSPRILDNRIEGMEEAVHLNKKCFSEFSGNLIGGSRVGLFCDFSSYPRIRDNLFDGNGLHIKLGKFQSSNWEVRAGSKRLVIQNAAQVGSRNPRLAEGPDEFPEVVDAADNWWDEKTLGEMAEKGPSAEISTLYDGHDLPEVTYDGFGEERYTIDKVVYWPTLEKTPVTAGLKGWEGKPGDLGF